MKKSLKNLLNADYSNKKSKSELLNVVQNAYNQIGKEQFKAIVNYDYEQLNNLAVQDLIGVIQSLNQEYQAQWEEGINGINNVLDEAKKIQSGDQGFQAANAADANFAAELSNLDFEKLIGGPLMACVRAQTSASLATVDFIKEVGFKDDELIMVDFSHTRKNRNPYYQQENAPDGANTTDEFIEEDVKVSVPFVSILSIPSLRIETCQIDFNVKLNSVYSRDVSDKVKLDAEVSGGWGPVKMKVSASYQRSSSTGVKVEKEYNLGVKVVASNDEMPAGLEKVLGIIAQ